MSMMLKEESEFFLRPRKKNICVTIFNTTIKMHEKVKDESAKETIGPQRKKLRTSVFENADYQVFQWLFECRKNKLPNSVKSHILC